MEAHAQVLRGNRRYVKQSKLTDCGHISELSFNSDVLIITNKLNSLGNFKLMHFEISVDQDVIDTKRSILKISISPSKRCNK